MLACNAFAAFGKPLSRCHLMLHGWQQPSLTKLGKKGTRVGVVSKVEQRIMYLTPKYLKVRVIYDKFPDRANAQCSSLPTARLDQFIDKQKEQAHEN
ncbi:MAG: hypothetical protein Q7J75_01760 [Rhodoferax sp.]|nr:hypothetical protein [Rhodoferax sp.]